MPMPNPQRTAEIRRVIDEFLLARLNDKLDKVPGDEGMPGDVAARRSGLRSQFEYNAWINDASRRVAQIQAVTHSLKPIHPDARGSSIFKPPMELPIHGSVGSHCLGADFDGDVVGNAAALDVFKFLKLPFEGKKLLDLMLANDPDLPAALSNKPEQAAEWIEAFTGITQPRGKAASHSLAKQLYWLTGSDPGDDSGYHLLGPLFATSLTHRVYQTINADRFSDEAKAARLARKGGEFSTHVLHDYPNMAVQKLGGTKPQNISQLNFERRGDNYLLASLPPRWNSSDLKPLLNTESMFHRFGRRPDVKAGVKTLLGFLKSDPTANQATSEQRDALARDLAGELLAFTAELRTLPPGWSQLQSCKLSSAEKHWLDPDGMAAALEQTGQAQPSDTSEQISQGFARWLNRQLRDPLPMGDPEYAHWADLALAELDSYEWEVNHAA